MTRLAFVSLVLLVGCRASQPPEAAASAAASSGCDSPSDSTFAFRESAEALSAFLEASLAEFAGRVPADRLTFPVSVSDCSVAGMDVFDLYDPDNKLSLRGDRIYFAQGHAYHFYSLTKAVSFSHIAFFEPGGVQVFEAVNCTDRGDAVEDALVYVRQHHPALATPGYLDRITRYREFGNFRLTDDIMPSLLCACEICYRP